jgi:hypothetical protein
LNLDGGQTRYSFDSGGQLSGYSFSVTFGEAATSGLPNAFYIPANTLFGYQRLGAGSVQFGFSNVVSASTVVDLLMVGMKFQSATFSGGQYTEVVGAPMVGFIPYGSANSSSSVLRNVFNRKMKDVGNAMAGISDILHLMVSCSDLF